MSRDLDLRDRLAFRDGLKEVNALTLALASGSGRARKATHKVLEMAGRRYIPVDQLTTALPLKDAKNSELPVVKSEQVDQPKLKKDKPAHTEHERKQTPHEKLFVKLTNDWTLHIVKRHFGKTTGKFDVYYISPGKKQRFRSRREIQRFIDLTEAKLSVDDFPFSMQGISDIGYITSESLSKMLHGQGEGTSTSSAQSTPSKRPSGTRQIVIVSPNDSESGRNQKSSAQNESSSTPQKHPNPKLNSISNAVRSSGRLTQKDEMKLSSDKITSKDKNTVSKHQPQEVHGKMMDQDMSPVQKQWQKSPDTKLNKPKNTPESLEHPSPKLNSISNAVRSSGRLTQKDEMKLSSDKITPKDKNTVSKHQPQEVHGKMMDQDMSPVQKQWQKSPDTKLNKPKNTPQSFEQTKTSTINGSEKPHINFSCEKRDSLRKLSSRISSEMDTSIHLVQSSAQVQEKSQEKSPDSHSQARQNVPQYKVRVSRPGGKVTYKKLPEETSSNESHDLEEIYTLSALRWTTSLQPVKSESHDLERDSPKSVKFPLELRKLSPKTDFKDFPSRKPAKSLQETPFKQPSVCSSSPQQAKQSHKTKDMEITTEHESDFGTSETTQKSKESGLKSHKAASVSKNNLSQQTRTLSLNTEYENGPSKKVTMSHVDAPSTKVTRSLRGTRLKQTSSTKKNIVPMKYCKKLRKRGQQELRHLRPLKKEMSLIPQQAKRSYKKESLIPQQAKQSYEKERGKVKNIKLPVNKKKSKRESVPPGSHPTSKKSMQTSSVTSEERCPLISHTLQQFARALTFNHLKEVGKLGGSDKSLKKCKDILEEKINDCVAPIEPNNGTVRFQGEICSLTSGEDKVTLPLVLKVTSNSSSNALKEEMTPNCANFQESSSSANQETMAVSTAEGLKQENFRPSFSTEKNGNLIKTSEKRIKTTRILEIPPDVYGPTCQKIVVLSWPPEEKFHEGISARSSPVPMKEKCQQPNLDNCQGLKPAKRHQENGSVSTGHNSNDASKQKTCEVWDSSAKNLASECDQSGLMNEISELDVPIEDSEFEIVIECPEAELSTLLPETELTNKSPGQNIASNDAENKLVIESSTAGLCRGTSRIELTSKDATTKTIVDVATKLTTECSEKDLSTKCPETDLTIEGPETSFTTVTTVCPETDLTAKQPETDTNAKCPETGLITKGYETVITTEYPETCIKIEPPETGFTNEASYRELANKDSCADLVTKSLEENVIWIPDSPSPQSEGRATITFNLKRKMSPMKISPSDCKKSKTIQQIPKCHNLPIGSMPECSERVQELTSQKDGVGFDLTSVCLQSLADALRNALNTPNSENQLIPNHENVEDSYTQTPSSSSDSVNVAKDLKILSDKMSTDGIKTESSKDAFGDVRIESIRSAADPNDNSEEDMIFVGEDVYPEDRKPLSKNKLTDEPRSLQHAEIHELLQLIKSQEENRSKERHDEMRLKQDKLMLKEKEMQLRKDELELRKQERLVFMKVFEHFISKSNHSDSS